MQYMACPILPVKLHIKIIVHFATIFQGVAPAPKTVPERGPTRCLSVVRELERVCLTQSCLVRIC